MFRIIAGLMVFLLAACSSAPPLQETMSRLNQRFDGHPAEDFFLSYGPASKIPLETGGTLYRWVSLGPQEALPQPVYHSYETSHGRFAVPDSFSTGAAAPQYCEIRIQANKRDIIQILSFVRDTPGKHSNSLCAEIFQD